MKKVIILSLILLNISLVAKSQKTTISEKKLNKIFNSIPSSLDISIFTKDLGIEYDTRLLNDASNMGNYNSKFKQSMNLGIYSVDLGYAYIYGQLKDGLGYLTAVKEMADALEETEDEEEIEEETEEEYEGKEVENSTKVSNLVDWKIIVSTVTSENKLDSLLLITRGNLEKIDKHLTKKGRGDLVVLIVTGAWVEQLYILTETIKKQSNTLLENRIIGQKNTLKHIIKLLNPYRKKINIRNLIPDLIKLQKYYNEVNTDIEKPLMDKETLEKISQLIKKIRNKIIK